VDVWKPGDGPSILPEKPGKTICSAAISSRSTSDRNLVLCTCRGAEKTTFFEDRTNQVLVPYTRIWPDLSRLICGAFLLRSFARKAAKSPLARLITRVNRNHTGSSEPRFSAERLSYVPWRNIVEAQNSTQ